MFSKDDYIGGCISNFGLLSSLFARTQRLFCPLFQKWRSARSSARRVGESAFSFISFSLGLHRQRKAAKESWYEYLVPLTMTTAYRLSAFSFEEIAPKEKAPQKENGVLSPTRRAPPLKRWTKQSLGAVRTMCKLTDKSQFAYRLQSDG